MFMNNLQMNPKIEINSLSINRSKNEIDSFFKYDIQASLEEIESSDMETKIKYEFMLLSNPKNIRINIEGLVLIQGNESEISYFLEQDENRFPRIVHTIYQELFPLLYINSKSLQIPCPAYKLSQNSQNPIVSQGITNTSESIFEEKPNVVVMPDVDQNQNPQIENRQQPPVPEISKL